MNGRMYNLSKSLFGEDFEIDICKAKIESIDAIKKIADVNKKQIGFVIKSGLLKQIENGEVLIAKNDNIIVGFCNYHHRRDSQTTMYEICVEKVHRRCNVGTLLLNALKKESTAENKTKIVLKMPEHLNVDNFYQSNGFKIVDITKSKTGTVLKVFQYDC